MIDYELNAKMAELCGHPCFRYTPALGKVIPFPFVCLLGDGTWALVTERSTEPWDPANNWNQVRDYVIPAVHRLPLQVQIIFNPNKTTVVMNSGITPMFLKQANHSYSSSRLVCELALEAGEKLRKTT